MSTATPAWPATWRTSATRPTGTSRSPSRSRTAWRSAAGRAPRTHQLPDRVDPLGRVLPEDVFRKDPSERSLSKDLSEEAFRGSLSKCDFRTKRPAAPAARGRRPAGGAGVAGHHRPDGHAGARAPGADGADRALRRTRN